MNLPWQLYDELGDPIAGESVTSDEALAKGILHGSAHVWIWRDTPSGKEILLQRRAAKKRNWPNLLDISAAGHIDFGETPEVAAVRETQEEIGLEVDPAALDLAGVQRCTMTTDSGLTENEFRWVYLLVLKSDKELTLQESEVASTQWMALDDFKRTVLPNNGDYVPQGDDYYRLLLAALEDK